MNVIILCLVSLVLSLELCSAKRRLKSVPHIIGGRESDSIVPYHVYMTCNERYFCGGALISAQHVLTAAHCIALTQKVNCAVKVTAGTKSRNDGGFYIYAESASMHPNYSEITNEHDIGVIKLKYGFIFSEKIQPISLTLYPPQNNEQITITGYGRINQYNGENSEVLKSYKSGLLKYEHCYIRTGPGRVYPTDLCDYGDTNQGTCQGDSGSPVVNGNYLIAVVSRGMSLRQMHSNLADCANGTPNILTSVYYHLDFINACLSL